MELYDTNAVCAWLCTLGLEDLARIAVREVVDGYVLGSVLPASGVSGPPPSASKTDSARVYAPAVGFSSCTTF